MHEFGMVDDFIHQLIDQWPSEKTEGLIRVGYGPGLVEESLTQAFEVHTAGTALEKVRIEFARMPCSVTCPCGTVLSAAVCQTDMPFAVCPSCQHVNPIPNFNTLELLHAG
jgi:Zn finger protein HypA/HybF involved in hydrogenase expression